MTTLLQDGRRWVPVLLADVLVRWRVLASPLALDERYRGLARSGTLPTNDSGVSDTQRRAVPKTSDFPSNSTPRFGPYRIPGGRGLGTDHTRQQRKRPPTNPQKDSNINYNRKQTHVLTFRHPVTRAPTHNIYIIYMLTHTNAKRLLPTENTHIYRPPTLAKRLLPTEGWNAGRGA